MFWFVISRLSRDSDFLVILSLNNKLQVIALYTPVPPTGASTPLAMIAHGITGFWQSSFAHICRSLDRLASLESCLHLLRQMRTKLNLTKSLYTSELSRILRQHAQSWFCGGKQIIFGSTISTITWNVVLSLVFYEFVCKTFPVYRARRDTILMLD